MSTIERLEARLALLESRLCAVEDVEAIRRLKALYGQLTEDSELAPLKGRIEKLRLTSVGHTLAGGTTEIQLATIATRGLDLPR